MSTYVEMEECVYACVTHIRTVWYLSYVFTHTYISCIIPNTHSFCLENFFVGVWTTASANNATPLLQGLLEPVSKIKYRVRKRIDERQ